ncbi:MAG: VCBS repeat-containing protein [Chloroflexia bacterium]|nr:VCBS repeat-containing protein [Chloroflexia bacterium]
MSDTDGRERQSSLLRYVREGAPTAPAPAEPPPEEAERPKWRQILMIAGIVVGVILVLAAVYLLVLRPRLNRAQPGAQATPAPGSTSGPTRADQAQQTLVLEWAGAEHGEMGWEGYQPLLGDVNGDGRVDLIWNLTAEDNRMFVGLSQGDGTFRFLPPQTRLEKRWQGFETFVGDLNRDGHADLVWNETAETNRIYAALAVVDNTFQLLPAQDRQEKRWQGFQTFVADVDGDGRSDLVWNETATTNRVYVGLAQPDGTFRFLPAQDREEEGWQGFRTLLGDVNGDGRSDLVWNEAAEANRIYLGLGQADGTFIFLPGQEHPEVGWEGAQLLVADVNGDGRSDLVWAGRPGQDELYVALAQADGDCQFLPVQAIPDAGWAEAPVQAGDLNGDGRGDLVWNQLDTANRFYVALGQEDGSFAFLSPQEHPEQGWQGFQLLLGDLDGDGRDDLIWNQLGESNRLRVGLVRD